MKAFEPTTLLGQLIGALRCMPGIGPKSAQRIAFHLLGHDREGGRQLAAVMAKAMDHIGRCARCRTFTETTLCDICSNTHRNQKQICVVEQPSELLAIEQATDYRGRYFVLGGRLSPLDGVGPEAIGLTQLQNQLAEGEVSELILALSLTVEGEATAQYIADLARQYECGVTRIAYGIPLGGELEFVDGGTLAMAFSARREV